MSEELIKEMKPEYRSEDFDPKGVLRKEDSRYVELTPLEQKFVDRIHNRLGGKILRVEVDAKDIKEFIDTAVDYYSPYIPDYHYITKPYNTTIDLSGDKIEEVLRVMPAVQISSYDELGSEYVFDFTMWSAVDRLDKTSITNVMRRKITPDIDIPFEYNNRTGLLMLRPGAYRGSITAECIPSQYVLDDIIDRNSQKWVFQYALALAKETVGRIRSKAQSSNVPIQLDGNTLLSEGLEEQRRLEAAIKEDQAGPVAMIR